MPVRAAKLPWVRFRLTVFVETLNHGPGNPVQQNRFPGRRRRVEETTIAPQGYSKAPMTSPQSFRSPALKEHCQARYRSDGSSGPQTPTAPGASREPCQSANISKHRTYHGSVLVQSPARQGHSSRMKQMFEDAGQPSQISPCRAEVTLCPTLPNISRRASPVRTGQRRVGTFPAARWPPTPEEGAILGIKTLNSKPASISELCADSWSDDSGYLYTESQARSPAIGSSSHQIERWLLGVSQEGSPDLGIRQSTTIGLASGTVQQPLQSYDDVLPRLSESPGPVYYPDHEGVHGRLDSKVSSRPRRQASR
ncbi:hypothetical protein BU23DRAFT_75595 [Bimuria novae-zelandiae CBS 107.79]|uniref:Uncharacterized protein n=1 Tax=Bimuria novae-zelandiae CBS 107.79 TaxID=1447943 RepID=A0A6A5VFK0_9PLEO|nr:hypothetical protein BU23DRAFT_75595 [Bimuria novae-zelandiae CBS 107.79]